MVKVTGNGVPRAVGQCRCALLSGLEVPWINGAGEICQGVSGWAKGEFAAVLAWVLISLPVTITIVGDMSEHQMLTRFSVSAFAALCFCLLTSPAYARQAYARQAYARQICVAWDPNDSYVNVRQSPNGDILEKKQNGSQVEVVGVSFDTNGRPWVDIVTRGVSGNSFIMKSLVRKCIPGSFNPDGLIVD